jgi:hypothetical protein
VFQIWTFISQNVRPNENQYLLLQACSCSSFVSHVDIFRCIKNNVHNNIVMWFVNSRFFFPFFFVQKNFPSPLTIFIMCTIESYDLAVTPSVKWLLLANLANCCRSWSRILSTSGDNVLERSKTPLWKYWKQNSLTYFAPKDQTRTKRTWVCYMFKDQTYVWFISRQQACGCHDFFRTYIFHNNYCTWISIKSREWALLNAITIIAAAEKKNAC